MGVHLLGQLAGDLDRLDLRGERTAERPFDEVLYPLLQVSQNADLGPPTFSTHAQASEGVPSAWAA